MRANALAGTYTVTVGESDIVTDVINESGESVHSTVGFNVFRITQIVQPNPGVIESQLMDVWRILTQKKGPPVQIEKPSSGITAPLFSPEADKARRVNLAVLIRRCACAELQHIASEGYDETPDLKGRSLSDIRHDFGFAMKVMIEEGLISETEGNYALRYFARKIDPMQPFSMGIIEVNVSTEAYKSMVDDILSWYNTKYLVNGYVSKQLDTNETEEVLTMRQYVLLCQTGLQQGKIDIGIEQEKLTEIFGAIFHMLKPDRTVVVEEKATA